MKINLNEKCEITIKASNTINFTVKNSHRKPTHLVVLWLWGNSNSFHTLIFFWIVILFIVKINCAPAWELRTSSVCPC